ncbi:MAG: hypothetical protein KQH63_07500 [Desulfobulbaceae bacterium]|nr:hypothetical protein [Desulfobulbaceae bacterium]
MCVEVKKQCECGKKEAQFHLRDNIMDSEVIDRLFCPSCSPGKPLNHESMIEDNGWIIEYDLTLARMYGISKLSMSAEQMNAAFIFDQGYATWREMYPGETEDIAGEREKIIAKKDENPQQYLQEINAWAITRINQLKAEGWRKARLA